ncbi:hypothetical protein GCM10007939_10980 [Amylibacter marinus]|uniref:Uncharacterized protein n=1 Tax=Amylibacter marinus TaxID=1475483 RepID=A0ABQ5VU22_9RHOB|nr:hypothetical protein [Amylibacter marinus]GLQ34815.1 hypothetical protein GCM10007939_10980 [Amylibacter marinus]
MGQKPTRLTQLSQPVSMGCCLAMALLYAKSSARGFDWRLVDGLSIGQGHLFQSYTEFAVAASLERKAL